MSSSHPFPTEIIQHGFPWSAFWAGIQALGSLAALGVALALPRMHEQRDRQRFRETILGYAQMVRDAVHALAIYSGDLSEVADIMSLQQAGVELKLPMIIASAERLPLAKLRSREAAGKFIRLLGAAQSYQDEIGKFVGNYQPSDLINGFTIRRFSADRVLALEVELRDLLS